MLESHWLAITTMAWLTSILTLAFGVYLDHLDMKRDVSHMVNVVGGLTSMLLWWLAAFGATSTVVVRDAVTIVETSTAIAYLFAGFGVFMLALALLGTGFLMNVTDIKDRALRGEL